MLSVEEYLGRVLALAGTTGVDEVPLAEAAGRVLARDLPALVAVPPFTNSAMDGFAVRASDVADAPVTLEVVGDVPAGARSVPTLAPGQAARIMTGAPLPPTADAVVPVEATDQEPGDRPLPTTVEIRQSVTVGRHVRSRGESVEVGAPALAAGTLLGPAALAAASSVGYGTLPVHRRPRVAVIATGSELVAPGLEPSFGQIPDSNSLLLAGLVPSFGGECTLVEAVGDGPVEFGGALARAVAAADVVVTSGGVSAGAFEPVRQALEGSVDFCKVAMQPGKPQAVGVVADESGRRVIVLGLPGNPVSVFVSAWAFLRPLLARLQGGSDVWRRIPATAGAAWRSPEGRRQYVPVALGADGVAMPVHELGSGSHLISALHLADGLAVVDEATAEVGVGDPVDVFLIG